MGLRTLMARLSGRAERTREVTVREHVSGIVAGLTPEDLYRTQPALRAVVSFLADNVASLPLHAYRYRSATDRERDSDSPIAMLIRRPGSGVTWHELVRDSMTDYLLHGWFRWVVLESADTESGFELTHIPAEWFHRSTTYDGLTPATYTFTNPVTQRRVELPASDVLWFRGYGGSSPLDPASPVDSLKATLLEQLRSAEFRNGVWENGGKVSSYITRPLGADWSNEARDRFAASWKARFSDDGTDTGGTPLLEDGMDLKSFQLNAKDAQWYEAAKLAREDVAACYHVNPSIIWHTDGQTYASAKENARSLYADTLAPILDMLEERMNAFLLPRIGAPTDAYVEFDLTAKLQGSFEEQASVLQTAVGRPYMVVDEARAKLNLPPIEGGDKLTVPLNVEVGGLASPTDTDPTRPRYSHEPTRKERGRRTCLCKADPGDSVDVGAVMRSFFSRQSRSVLAAIQRARADGTLHDVDEGGVPVWWDASRWGRELADDLYPVLMAIVGARGAAAIAELGLGGDFDAASCAEAVRGMCEWRATVTNNVTRDQLVAAIDGDATEGTAGATPEGVFEKAQSQRAGLEAESFATGAAGYAGIEAVAQTNPDGGVLKTWRTHGSRSGPRRSHARLDGETVPYDSPFSNGAMWPGDRSLPPEESCNCRCTIELSVEFEI